ncbi:MAG: hypothetical protein ACLR8Y_04845 [Alistipes indistinctus]
MLFDDMVARHRFPVYPVPESSTPYPTNPVGAFLYQHRLVPVDVTAGNLADHAVKYDFL